MVVTDHQPLKWILNSKQTAARLSRWLIRLENYKFRIEYRAGKKHVNADALSRLPYEPTTSEELSNSKEDYVISSIRSDTNAVNKTIIFFEDNDIKIKQLNDDDIRWIYQLILEYKDKKPEDVVADNDTRKAYLDQYDDLMVEGDNVYRKFMNANQEEFRQFLVPKNFVITILDKMHKSIFNGHLGRDKTIAKINERFYWPKMYVDTNKYLQECDKCQKIKSPPPRKAPLKPLKPKKPLELITMDVAGPLRTTTSDNKYILVICDHFTKYTVCYAKPDQTAS